ncbi:MAG: RluA family pseudouridine synthase [Nanoarchaeota archaeon]
MKIPILYEDKDVVVINKPAGLIVHPDGHQKNKKTKTLVDWILKKYPRIKNVGEPIILDDDTKILRPGIVHRIDRDTTGALIIAKNKETFEFLKGQFKNRKVHKVYQAFVYGDLKDERGMIDRPIGRSSNDFRKWSAQRGVRGEKREAVTYFKVLGKKDDITFVEAIPKTGRTHQIRVHFSAINHPLVQDKLYATDFYLSKKQQLGFKRMALHARELEITLPSGKLLNIKAPYPEDFEEAITKIHK